MIEKGDLFQIKRNIENCIGEKVQLNQSPENIVNASFEVLKNMPRQIETNSMRTALLAKETITQN
jgi:glutamate racemase